MTGEAEANIFKDLVECKGAILYFSNAGTKIKSWDPESLATHKYHKKILRDIPAEHTMCNGGVLVLSTVLTQSLRCSPRYGESYC